MTLGRFATVVGASRRWVLNAFTVLGLSRRYSENMACRVGLAREIHLATGMALSRAYALAPDALASWPAHKRWTHEDEGGMVSVVVDVERFLSTFAVRLSLSRTIRVEKRRGRPRKHRLRGLALARRHGLDLASLHEFVARTPEERLQRLEQEAPEGNADGRRPARCREAVGALAQEGVRFVVVGGIAARLHGSARFTSDLDICYEATPANRERLARVLRGWQPYPSGVAPGLPFRMDAAELSRSPAMMLATSVGELHVMDRVPGVGAYDAGRARSEQVKLDGVVCSVLSLPALVAAKRACARTTDPAHLAELETLLVLHRSGSPA